MLIGVTSDTHDNGRLMIRSVELFREKNVDLVIHCGDWDAAFTLSFYQNLHCPLKGVLGNGDPDITKFWWVHEKAHMNLDLELDARFLNLELAGRKVAVFHGDSQPLLDFLIDTQIFDAIFFGHDHQARIAQKGKTLLVNPGSFVGVLLPTHPISPYTVALYDTTLNSAELIEIAYS